MSHNLQQIFDSLNDATVRMEQIVLLAGMLDSEAMVDPLKDLFSDDPDSLKRCFPDMPKALADLDDSDEFAETFCQWASREGKLGFVIQFARPVMEWRASGTSAGYSWGRYNTEWVYGESLDEAVQKGLAWARERERVEKEKSCQTEGAT